MICDHVDHFLFTGARQIRYRPVQSFLFDLGNFLERQIRLSSVWRSRLLVAFNELARQPAKHVIGNTGSVTNIGIFCKPAWFESLIGELFDETFQRHAVLQGDRGKRADGIHQSANRAAFFRHGDEELARLTVLVQTNSDVPFVTGNLEFVGQRYAGIRHAMADWLIEPRT